MEAGVRRLSARCCTPGTRAAYLEDEDTRAVFELLMLLDQLCIKEKIVSPSGGQYLMRPRPHDEIQQM